MYFISVPITIMRILLSVNIYEEFSENTWPSQVWKCFIFWSEKYIRARVPGLKIIFELCLVMLTGQTNFSSVMSCFWLVKILKILTLKNFPIKVAENSFQYFPRLAVSWVITTTLYWLMPKSWYQQTTQSSGNKLLLFLWHNRSP